MYVFFTLQECYRSCRGNIEFLTLNINKAVAIISLETCFDEVYPDGIGRYLSSSEETEN
jgi:hypothetical protein